MAFRQSRGVKNTWQVTGDGSCRAGTQLPFADNPRLNLLLDADVLAELASLKGAEQVRLCSPADQWPDGFMKFQAEFTTSR